MTGTCTDTHTHTHTIRGRVRKSQGEAAFFFFFVAKLGKCHTGNEFRSRVGSRCSCALAVGTGPDGRWAKFSLHTFTAAVCYNRMRAADSPSHQTRTKTEREEGKEWRNVEQRGQIRHWHSLIQQLPLAPHCRSVAVITSCLLHVCV